MYTEADVKRMLSGVTGEANASPVGYTANDVKSMLKNVRPSQRTIDVKVNKNYVAPQAVSTPSVTKQPTPQQTENYNKLQELAAGGNVPTMPKVTTQQRASGRDFVVSPIAKLKPQDDEAKNAFISDYKAKHGGSDLEAGIMYNLENSSFLKGADALIRATNPISAMYRTAQAAEDVANTAINGKPAEPYALGQAYIKEADKARQEFREMTGNNVAGDIALAAGDMLSAAGTAGMFGVGLTPYLAATSGMQTAGEDVNKGRGVLPSVVHGAAGGGITYLVEGLGGIGQTKLGQTLTNKIMSMPAIKSAIEKASPQIAKMLGNSIVRFIATAGQEGLEEAIEYPAQTLLENVIFDDAAPFDLKEWWNNAVVGVGVGALFGGSNYALNRLASVAQYRGQNVPQTSQNVTESAQSVIEPAETVIEPAETVIVAKENPTNSQTVGDLQGGTVVNKSEAKATSAELITKLRNSIPEISKSRPVAQITGNEFQKGEKGLVEQVGDFFRTLGNKVFRPGLGEVRLDERGVKSSMAHGVGRRKAAAFAAVPKIIENGTEIDYQKNWKDRGYNTRVFAAPIMVGSNEVNYVAAVITQGTDNRYYLHEVLDQDGNIIYSKKRETGNVQTDLLPEGSIGNPVSVTPILPQAQNKSNNNISSGQTNNAQPDMLAPLRERMQANRNEMQRLSDQRQKLREAQQLKRESYSSIDAAELMQRIEDIRQQPQGYRTQSIRKLAGDIVDSAQMRDRTLTEQYNEARQIVRNTRFALAERDRADLGMSYADFARENRGRIKLGNDGSRVDSVYMHLNSLAPDMFPADITHPADQLKQIAYFMDITAPGFVNPYSEDVESGIGYIENRLKKAVGEPDMLKPLREAMQTAEPQQEYTDEYADDYDVPPIGLTAEEYEQLQSSEDAEISRDLNERLDQIIKEYESERVFDDAAKLRKADTGVREAVMEFITSDEGITEGADLSDVAGLLQNGFFYNTDISRALDHTARAGKRGELKLTDKTAKQTRDALYEAIEKPWAEAKAGYTDGVTAQINRTADIFEKLGIKPGSKESAAVQWIGEGQRQVGKDIVEYTESDLKRDFPDRWQDIMKGAAAARQIYDEYIDKVNAARVKMYPEIEAKAQNEINRLNARAQSYHANARAQEEYIAQKRAELARARSQIKGGNTLTQTDLARQRQALALENTIMAAEQKRNSQLARAQQYDARAAEIQRQIDTGEILRQKRLIPRKDYFHHFTEMAEGFGGLANILNTPSDISSNLAGVSEFTKPKGKFWGALEQRKGGAYTEDAVGGLAKYIPAAEYAVNIDPFIAHMRGTIKNLAVATAETKNANSLITYLTDWTNELAGKTNKFDRGIMDAFPDRRFMRALTWVNNRVKANAVVGNLSSAIVQVGNIPNATTYIPNPQRWAEAFEKLATGKGNLAESKFLKERYLGGTLERLENKSGVRKAAEGLLEFGDRQAAKLIWQAAYEQYNKGGPRRGKRSYQNAADYADDITRRSIAGRGIGELPITQKSKLIGLASPFMVEVNNTYHVVKDAIGENDAAGVMALAITANLLNALMEPLRGNRPLFDPIDAGWDALKILVGKEEAEYIWELLRASDEPEEEPEEDLYGLKEMGRRLRDAGKRLGGEVVGNLPYAQALATMLGSENSEKLFGEADPTRYGTGNIGLSAIAEPIAQIANGEKVDWLGAAANIATPYGGKQLERVIRGAQDIGWLPYDTELTEEGIEFKRNQMPLARSAKGNVQFPITSAGDMVKDMLLGKWSTEAGRQYLDAGNKPLTEKQTAQLEEAIEMGIPAEVYYKAYRAQVKQVSDKDKDGKTIKNSQDKNKKKVIDQEAQGLTKAQRQKLYEYFGVSKEVW